MRNALYKRERFGTSAGYTLVEAMAAMSITTIMFVCALQAFSSGSRISYVNNLQSGLAGESRRGLESMVQELRNSDLARITVVTPSVLQFQVPTNITQNGVITWSGAFRYSLGGTTGQQLIRQDMTTNAVTVLANRITAMQFVRNNNPATLTITVQATDQTPDGITIPVALNGQVDFRN